MDASRFDGLTRSLTVPGTRRRLLGLVAAVPLTRGLHDILAPEDVEAHGRRKRRVKRHKHGSGRKRQRKAKKRCTPDAASQTCAGKCGSVANNCRQAVDCGSCASGQTCCDGGCVDLQTDARFCGGCGIACQANERCISGVCRNCDVICTGSAAQCGSALQTALDGSKDTLYVCPGTYLGGFTINRDVTVIGAGQGTDPTQDTILDGGDTLQVLRITSGSPTLRQMHISHGLLTTTEGGGILHLGDTLTVEDVTVADNFARDGGGISSSGGNLVMTRCTVRDNVANYGDAAFGGGLYLSSPATLTDCVISGNEADGYGGGLCLVGGASPVILAGTTVIQQNEAWDGGGIRTEASWTGSLTIGEGCQITGNTAHPGQGGGIYHNGSGDVILEGLDDPSLIVINNCDDNCVGNVPKCADMPVHCED